MDLSGLSPEQRLVAAMFFDATEQYSSWVVMLAGPEPDSGPSFYGAFTDETEAMLYAEALKTDFAQHDDLRDVRITVHGMSKPEPI